jgi:hypothetical protein
MAKKKQPAPKPTREELAEYFRLNEQRLAASRQASDFKKLQDAIEQKVLDYVRQEGGKERCCIVSDYRLSIDKKANRVEWKTAYMEELGQAAAEALIKAAGTHDDVTIEPPTKAA